MRSEEIDVQIDNDEAKAAGLVFFPISLTKLVILSIFTLGLYEVYWFYKNWHFVKRREKSDILPVVRSIFAYFFCYSLFSRVSDYAAKTNVNKPPAGILAICWIVTMLLWKLPDPYWLLSFAAVFFMLPIQSSINSINAKLAPEHDRNNRFSAWNITAIVLGGIFLLLSVIGTFFPADQI